MPEAMVVNSNTMKMQTIFAEILQLNDEKKRQVKALRKTQENFMKKIDAFNTLAKDDKDEESSEWKILTRCLTKSVKKIINRIKIIDKKFDCIFLWINPSSPNWQEGFWI